MIVCHVLLVYHLEADAGGEEGVIDGAASSHRMLLVTAYLHSQREMDRGPEVYGLSVVRISHDDIAFEQEKTMFIYYI